MVSVNPQGEDGRDEDGTPHSHHQDEEANIGAPGPSNLFDGYLFASAAEAGILVVLGITHLQESRSRGHGHRFIPSSSMFVGTHPPLGRY